MKIYSTYRFPSQKFGWLMHIIFFALLSIIAVPQFSIGSPIKESGREIITHIIMSILIVTTVATIRLDTKEIRINRIDLLVILYFIYSLVNSFFKATYLPKFCHTSIMNLEVLVVYLLVKRTFEINLINNLTFRLIIKAVLVLIICVAYLQIIEVLPSGHPSFNITGGFFNPAPFAIFLLSLTIFCTPIIYRRFKQYIRYTDILFESSIIIFAIFLIIACFSRAAWISLILSIFLMLFLIEKASFVNKLKVLSAKWLVIIVLPLAIIVLGVWLINLKWDSAIGRLLTWNVSLQMLGDNLLTGVGANNFQVKYLSYQHDFFMNQETGENSYRLIAGDVRFAFNDCLQILCEEGLVGFSMLVGALYLAFTSTITKISAKKHHNNDRLFVIAVLVSFTSILFSGLTSYPLFVWHIKMFFFLLLAILSLNSGIAKISLQLHRSIFFKKVLLIPFLSSAFLLFYYGIKRWESYRLLNEINWPESYGQIHTYPYIADDPYYLMKLAKIYADNGDSYDALVTYQNTLAVSSDKEIYYGLSGIYIDLKRFDLAEENLKFVSKSQPNLLTPKYMLAKLYYLSGAKRKWELMSKIVMDEKPKVVSFETLYMQQEIRKLYLTEKYSSAQTDTGFIK